MKHARVFLLLGLAVASISRPLLAADSPAAVSRVPEGPAHTPLHLAALRGDAEAVETLLRQGADPNALNAYGATPLHYGIGSERIVAALLARGARPNVVSQAGVTPLFGAVGQAESFAVVRRLIEAGADVNQPRDTPPEALGGGSVLSLAIAGGDRRTLALLLDPKTGVDAKYLGPALVAAAQADDAETTRLLLARGANPDTVAGNTATALNTALRGGHDEVAKLLLARGADLGIKSLRGYSTPPMAFSAYGDGRSPELARLLLERGADIHAANDLGETALDFALKHGGETALVRFLRERGAKPLAAPTRPKTVPARAVPADSATRAALVRESAQRAIDLMQRSSTAFLESAFVRNQSRCVSCHQQSLPALAYGLARERGLRVDEQAIGRQLAAKSSQRTLQAGRALELIAPTGGPVLSLGHDAEELHALRFTADANTSAMSHYLLGVQNTDGSWPEAVRRMPMGDGALVATAWALRAVQLYPPSDRQADAAAAVSRGRAWLARQSPGSLNERVFQLLGLAWAGEAKERLQPWAEALLKEQRADGGWGQLAGLDSDAWAAGSALHALHLAGIAPTHAAYRRGVDFLLRTQFSDGSWWVRSRAWPFQPHFDSAFPHGRDQWISAAGTAWATAALLHTLEPTVAPASLRDGRQMMAAYRQSEPKAPAGSAAPATAAAATVDFARDIQPLFQRSCAECHSGARPKGGFAIVSREGLMRGGFNREPAIVPGRAAESDLFRYVSDQVEDLEMPPLDRRDKYPALTAEELARVRAWIDAGAPWPAAAGSAPIEKN